MMLSLSALLFLQSFGCVIRYGEGAATAAAEAAAPDFSEVEDRLASLEVGVDDVDARDRLQSAAALAATFRAPGRAGFPPEAQYAALDYLYDLLEIEERGATDPIPRIIGVGAVDEEEIIVAPPIEGGIEEEELGGDTGEEPPDAGEEPPDAGDAGGDDAALESAREDLARGHYASAIKTLAPLRADPDADALRAEAIDGFVHAERERAGELFLDARDLPEGERAVAMASVLELLEELLEAYPDSVYTSALERNIELVERAVEEADAGE